MLKLVLFVALSAFAVSAMRIQPMLGEKKCTWGPTYWCSNITNAAGCNAVHHCIQTVWEHKELEPDTDSVCQICMKMVQQARDQLESNETMEEIKEVFEGSCKLIPVKIIDKECCKLADDFIPELVDTLASQMNPQVVCNVAGLCNNDHVDKLLEEHEQQNQLQPAAPPKQDTCKECHTVVGMMEDKFIKMSRDQVLQSLLKVCARMGSFSDACSNIIVTYFADIYKHLQNNFNANEVCLMSGECSAQFHTHAKVEITPLSHIGYVPVEGNTNDDLPCDLCKQLVGHLRDLLVANTTEEEFKTVMEGLCKQTGKFKDECLSLVDQYYPEIYNFLVQQLNSSEVCMMTGICPTNEKDDAPIMPLLTPEAASKAVEIMSSAKKPVKLSRVSLTKNQPASAVRILEPEQMQLPIERMMPPLSEVYNRQACTFCEYFLHYLQQAITNPKAMDEIKDAVDKACDRLPSSINETCVEFVNTYGDAVVALLAQEIDPSTICPALRLCPGKQLQNVEIFMEAKPQKPNCALCLFAVTKLEEEVKDKRSRDSIKHALSKLCSHLSGNLKGECDDFVHTYTDELIEMFIADMTPQEVCVFLKLCTDKAPAPTLPALIEHISTTPATVKIIPQTTELSNEIPDDTVNGQQLESNKPECVICEFAMQKLEQLLENKTTEEDIKKAVHNLCNHLPHSVRTECNGFVNQYADMVIALLDSALKPDEICAYLKLCDQKTVAEIVPQETIRSPQCTLCKMVMFQVEKMLDGKITKDRVEQALHKVCKLFPSDKNTECNQFVTKYGNQIVDLLTQAVQPGEICSLLFFCVEQVDIIKLEITKCAVCEEAAIVIQRLLKNPRIDHSIEHVLEKTCRALPKKDQALCKDMVDIYGAKMFDLVAHMNDVQGVCQEVNLCSTRPSRPQLLGANECTYGPSYWCENMSNALSCGALQHCQEKVWKAMAPAA